MTPVYLRLSDLSDRAREDVERIAREWLGSSPWLEEADTDAACCPAWWDEIVEVIPLHLGAGADLGVRILQEWTPGEIVAVPLHHPDVPHDPELTQALLAALLAAAPKE